MTRPTSLSSARLLAPLAAATLFVPAARADGFGPELIATKEAHGSHRARGADIDGDGDLDMVVAARYDDEVQWYENLDSLGTFGPKIVVGGPADGACSLFVDDIDGDGDIDVLSTSRYDDKVSWYENLDGLGAFGPQQNLTEVADGAQAVVTSDIDADGDRDIVYVSRFDDTLGWFENLDGLGSFSSSHLISLDADGPNSVVAADMDGDGDDDVVTGSRYDDKVAWYENTDGLGAFGPQIVISLLADHCQMVKAADIDGDGDQDVASASRFDDKIAWYENLDGLGTFGPQNVLSTQADEAKAIHAADVDGDGDQDLLSGSFADNTVAWFENLDGLGTFGAEVIISEEATQVQWVTSADLDGDGDEDVIYSGIGDPDSHLEPGDDDKVAWFKTEFCSASEQAIESVMSGSPGNPNVLLPGLTSAPILCGVWDPAIDHTSFMPTAVVDLLAIGSTSVNIPSAFGTIICYPPVFVVQSPAPGIPFSVPIPGACVAVGVTLCAQGAAIDSGGTLALTNALALKIGTF